MFSFMAGMLGALAASVLTVFIPLMVLAGIICAALPMVHVYYKRKKRFDQFLEQLPDALDLISRAHNNHADMRELVVNVFKSPRMRKRSRIV